ncbi:magnesium transporter NIPA2 [Toxorhynchites rutilus septentrionalis]|uniref:magnesium transporter NIPA2 n=1 Tax=Toxorhynchites rutilus septentrionalis TaxID=329112 RepID=UPI00247AC630|nr:magnesium transporter NIPA2 [Toxorhynchites rutilus septentrionalis]
MASRESVNSLYKQQDFYIGLSLALSSSFFIGSSFIIKKIGLIRLSRVGSMRASAGGFGYLKDWIWWAGLICMGIGEAANFAAYAFAPASLVTPLGALSVIVTAVLASKFLKERLNLLGKLGCFLCIIGSTIIVIHSPKDGEIDDLGLLVEKLQAPAFITYVMLILSLSLFIGCCWGPRYGHKNVLVYILLCSAIGSLTVMSCKALGLALRDTISGKSNDFGMWLPYFLIVITAVFVGIQINYLNKALDMFNTSIVTPIYYVIFTTLVISASAILFKEWGRMKAVDVIGDLCGFFVVIVAVILLNAFREMDISLNDVKGIMRPKREMLSQKGQFEEFLGESSNGTQKLYGTGDYRSV